MRKIIHSRAKIVVIIYVSPRSIVLIFIFHDRLKICIPIDIINRKKWPSREYCDRETSTCDIYCKCREILDF